MKAEYSFFLQCLSDYCNNLKTEKPSRRIDLNILFQLAAKHSVEGIVYHQLYRWIGQRIGKESFQNAVVQDAYFSVNRSVLLREIAEHFHNHSIPFICMKGALLRDYYPTPELRSMGDLDLIIYPKDREESDWVMTEELGYSKFVDNHAVWTYNLDQFEVEIHDHMFYEHLTNRYDYRSYFDQVWEHAAEGMVFGFSYPGMYVPDDMFHFLYLMTHTAKHIINKGSGFRAYLDMVFLSKRITSQHEWDQIEVCLKELNLLEFTKTCFALCERWFHVKMPMEHASLDNRFYEEVTEKTFEDGVFGLRNQQNFGASAAKEVLRSGEHYWKTALKLVIRNLFPSYEDMQLIPWYSFVDERPWLLPAAWIYRWLYCLVYKLPRGIRLLTEPFLHRKQIEKREEYIRDWGL